MEPIHPVRPEPVRTTSSSLCERRELLAVDRTLRTRGQRGVLATLVGVEGSSYRRPGARLLAAGEQSAGTISGGCLEAEVVRRAPWLVRAGAVVERYSMQFDDTAEIPFGLGCGGVLHLLLEPLGTPEAEAQMDALKASVDGAGRTVIHFLPGKGRPLRRLVLDENGAVVFASTALSAEKISCARGLTPGGEYDGRFVERLDPPQRLLVLGAGDDARPLVEFAAALGWRVVVADGRANLATAQRFPRAHHVEVLGDAGALARFGIGPDDALVLMTHSYEQDRALLAEALPLRPRYLGLLGSRHRSSLLVSEAAAQRGLNLDTCCELLHAPVGMDLGGDGPEAIALAIVAEIQAVCHGKPGNARQMDAAEVALQIERGGSENYLRAQCALGTV